MIKKLLITVACALSLSGAVFAAEVSISMTPKTPEPFSQVTLKAISYDIDVDTSMVTWKVRGAEIKKGIGEKTLSLSLGGSGSSVPVTVTVADSYGNVLQASMTVTPQNVMLLWEAPESYVPPFYEGKALPAQGAKIRVLALTDMAASSPLAYTWFEGKTQIDSASGAGKRVFPTALDILEDQTDIKVRVKNTSGSVAEKTISISPHSVMPTLYAYDALLGVDLTRPYTRRIELDGDVTLSLEPLYLSTNGLEQTASYDWYVDGLPVTPEEKTLLSLKPKQNAFGVRNLSVSVAQEKRRLQKADETLQVVFDTRK